MTIESELIKMGINVDSGYVLNLDYNYQLNVEELERRVDTVF